METTSAPRIVGTSDYAVMRSTHPLQDARTRRPMVVSDPRVNRENKYRYKRSRTRSDEAETDAYHKRIRYSKPEYNSGRVNRPRYSSESTHSHHRREKSNRYEPATETHHRERRRSDSERDKRYHHFRSHDSRNGSRHSEPTLPEEHRIGKYDENHRSAVAEGFIRSVSGTYKMMNRAEDKKRILSNQLPSCIKSKSIANSFIFCTSTDGDILESEVASMRRHQKYISDFGKLDRAIHNVGCRIRKKLTSSALNSQQISIIRSVRIISIAFNRIAYVARIKHYCDRESRLSNYLRDQLTKRCSEGSRLNSGIRRFIGSVDVEKNRDLCLVFVGMLCQTPHMWARSIRLLTRLKIFFQNVIMKMFSDEKIDLRDVFEMQYHSAAQKILTQVKQYTTSAFMLNDAVSTVVDMIRQRQSVSSTSSTSQMTAEPMYDQFDTFSPPRTPMPRPDLQDYTFYPEHRQTSDTSDTDSQHDDCETDSTDSSDTHSSGRTPKRSSSDSDSDRKSKYGSDPFSPREKSSHTSRSRSNSTCSSSSSSSESSKSSSRSRSPSVTLSPYQKRSSDSESSGRFKNASPLENVFLSHNDRYGRESPQMTIHIGHSPTSMHTNHESINITFDNPR